MFSLTKPHSSCIVWLNRNSRASCIEGTSILSKGAGKESTKKRARENRGEREETEDRRGSAQVGKRRHEGTHRFRDGEGLLIHSYLGHHKKV